MNINQGFVIRQTNALGYVNIWDDRIAWTVCAREAWIFDSVEQAERFLAGAEGTKVPYEIVPFKIEYKITEG